MRLQQTTAWGRYPSLRGIFPFHRSFCNRNAFPTASRRLFLSEGGESSPWSRHDLPHGSSFNDGFRNSSVQAQNTITKHTAYIALGSNLGDRIAMIEKACNEMTNRGIIIKRTSGLWETEPMYVLEQDKFLNGACEVGQRPKSSLTYLIRGC